VIFFGLLFYEVNIFSTFNCYLSPVDIFSLLIIAFSFLSHMVHSIEQITKCVLFFYYRFSIHTKKTIFSPLFLFLLILCMDVRLIQNLFLLLFFFTCKCVHDLETSSLPSVRWMIDVNGNEHISVKMINICIQKIISLV